MNQKRKKQMCLSALLTLMFVTLCAQSQAQDVGGMRPQRDHGRDLRTRTWSICAQGGLSWATDVWYPNHDAKRSYRQSPSLGGGVDYTIRPWVRVGGEYLWSRYRREQRFSSLDMSSMPVKAYGNYLMYYHNAKLGVQFNLLGGRERWFNIWTGTGGGYTYASGCEYSILLSTTKTIGGVTTPFVPGETLGNDGSVTITGNVRTTNQHEKFSGFYVPASLHVEADLSRRLTVGLKGEVDCLLGREKIAPRSYAFALVTMRYNFVSACPCRSKGR